MTREAMIERIIKQINQLPLEKAEEISDFGDSIIKQFEEQQFTKGIQKLTSESQTFDFLNSEKELYSVADLKEVYNS